MKVCIAEKPSVAKEIAEILGAKTKKDGYFEGNGYQITWTFGHLCTLKEPEDYHPDLKRWRLEHLPILPPKFGIKEISNKGISKQLNVISRLVSNATEVINCGDAGQEGEVIQRWVLSYVKCTKPVKRLWISSLTSEAIQEGFKTLKDSKNYDKLYAAGSSRAIGDWLLGINATRLYTLKFGQNKQVLSIGRVQTPTLALIVNRYLEIQNFKPENYWEIKTRYKEVLFSARKGKFYNQEEAAEFINKIKEHEFTIVAFTKKKGKESPPKLFDLTSLQVECNKKFGFSADQTLKQVQALYEKKLVTYPRVDTCFLPNDMFPKIKGILESLDNYKELTNPLLSEPIRKSKLVFDDKKVTDHHAIIPTNVKGYVGGTEQQVYDLIVRRFLAAFYPDCIVSKTEVLGEAAEQEFKATGKQILEEGWRKVYLEEKEDKDEKDPKKDQDDDSDSNQLLPEFVEGEKGPHAPELAEKQTRPPKLHTEATLLRAMETAGKQVADEELRDLMKENGIGRPSTRANIIETLFRRNYIAKEKKNLVPTITGVQLIGTIQYDLLKSAELTGTWEKKLRDIEKGVFETGVFLNEMKSMIQEIVHQVKTSRSFSRIETLIKPEETSEKKPKEKVAAKTASQPNLCLKCHKGKMLKGKSAMGCSEYKAGCNFIIPFELFGKVLSEKQVSTLIQKKKSPLIKGLKQSDRVMNGYIVLNQNFGFEILEQEEKPTEEPKKNLCPKCKKGEVIKGQKAYGCANWKSGCDFRLPMQYEMVEINSEVLSQLLFSFKATVKDAQGNPLDRTLQLDKKTFQLSLI